MAETPDLSVQQMEEAGFTFAYISTRKSNGKFNLGAGGVKDPNDNFDDLEAEYPLADYFYLQAYAQYELVWDCKSNPTKSSVYYVLEVLVDDKQLFSPIAYRTNASVNNICSYSFHVPQLDVTDLQITVKIRDMTGHGTSTHETITIKDAEYQGAVWIMDQGNHIFPTECGYDLEKYSIAGAGFAPQWKCVRPITGYVSAGSFTDSFQAAFQDITSQCLHKKPEATTAYVVIGSANKACRCGHGEDFVIESDRSSCRAHDTNSFGGLHVQSTCDAETKVTFALATQAGSISSVIVKLGAATVPTSDINWAEQLNGIISFNIPTTTAVTISVSTKDGDGFVFEQFYDFVPPNCSATAKCQDPTDTSKFVNCNSFGQSLQTKYTTPTAVSHWSFSTCFTVNDVLSCAPLDTNTAPCGSIIVGLRQHTCVDDQDNRIESPGDCSSLVFETYYVACNYECSSVNGEVNIDGKLNLIKHELQASTKVKIQGNEIDIQTANNVALMVNIDIPQSATKVLCKQPVEIHDFLPNNVHVKQQCARLDMTEDDFKEVYGIDDHIPEWIIERGQTSCEKLVFVPGSNDMQRKTVCLPSYIRDLTNAFDRNGIQNDAVSDGLTAMISGDKFQCSSNAIIEACARTYVTPNPAEVCSLPVGQLRSDGYGQFVGCQKCGTALPRAEQLSTAEGDFKKQLEDGCNMEITLPNGTELSWTGQACEMTDTLCECSTGILDAWISPFSSNSPSIDALTSEDAVSEINGVGVLHVNGATKQQDPDFRYNLVWNCDSFMAPESVVDYNNYKVTITMKNTAEPGIVLVADKVSYRANVRVSTDGNSYYCWYPLPAFTTAYQSPQFYIDLTDTTNMNPDVSIPLYTFGTENRRYTIDDYQWVVTTAEVALMPCGSVDSQDKVESDKLSCLGVFTSTSIATEGAAAPNALELALCGPEPTDNKAYQRKFAQKQCRQEAVCSVEGENSQCICQNGEIWNGSACATLGDVTVYRNINDRKHVLNHTADTTVHVGWKYIGTEEGKINILWWDPENNSFHQLHDVNGGATLYDAFSQRATVKLPDEARIGAKIVLFNSDDPDSVFVEAIVNIYQYQWDPDVDSTTKCPLACGEGPDTRRKCLGYPGEFVCDGTDCPATRCTEPRPTCQVAAADGCRDNVSTCTDNVCECFYGWSGRSCEKKPKFDSMYIEIPPHPAPPVGQSVFFPTKKPGVYYCEDKFKVHWKFTGSNTEFDLYYVNDDSPDSKTLLLNIPALTATGQKVTSIEAYIPNRLVTSDQGTLLLEVKVDEEDSQVDENDIVQIRYRLTHYCNVQYYCSGEDGAYEPCNTFVQEFTQIGNLGDNEDLTTSHWLVENDESTTYLVPLQSFYDDIQCGVDVNVEPRHVRCQIAEVEIPYQFCKDLLRPVDEPVKQKWSTKCEATAGQCSDCQEANVCNAKLSPDASILGSPAVINFQMESDHCDYLCPCKLMCHPNPNQAVGTDLEEWSICSTTFDPEKLNFEYEKYFSIDANHANNTCSDIHLTRTIACVREYNVGGTAIQEKISADATACSAARKPFADQILDPLLQIDYALSKPRGLCAPPTELELEKMCKACKPLSRREQTEGGFKCNLDLAFFGTYSPAWYDNVSVASNGDTLSKIGFADTPAGCYAGESDCNCDPELKAWVSPKGATAPNTAVVGALLGQEYNLVWECGDFTDADYMENYSMTVQYRPDPNSAFSLLKPQQGSYSYRSNINIPQDEGVKPICSAAFTFDVSQYNAQNYGELSFRIWDTKGLAYVGDEVIVDIRLWSYNWYGECSSSDVDHQCGYVESVEETDPAKIFCYRSDGQKMNTDEEVMCVSAKPQSALKRCYNDLKPVDKLTCSTSARNGKESPAKGYCSEGTCKCAKGFIFDNNYCSSLSQLKLQKYTSNGASTPVYTLTPITDELNVDTFIQVSWVTNLNDPDVKVEFFYTDYNGDVVAKQLDVYNHPQNEYLATKAGSNTVSVTTREVWIKFPADITPTFHGAITVKSTTAADIFVETNALKITQYAWVNRGIIVDPTNPQACEGLIECGLSDIIGVCTKYPENTPADDDIRCLDERALPLRCGFVGQDVSHSELVAGLADDHIENNLAQYVNKQNLRHAYESVTIVPYESCDTGFSCKSNFCISDVFAKVTELKITSASPYICQSKFIITWKWDGAAAEKGTLSFGASGQQEVALSAQYADLSFNKADFDVDAGKISLKYKDAQAADQVVTVEWDTITHTCGHSWKCTNDQGAFVECESPLTTQAHQKAWILKIFDPAAHEGENRSTETIVDSTTKFKFGDQVYFAPNAITCVDASNDAVSDPRECLWISQDVIPTNTELLTVKLVTADLKCSACKTSTACPIRFARKDDTNVATGYNTSGAPTECNELCACTTAPQAGDAGKWAVDPQTEATCNLIKFVRTVDETGPAGVPTTSTQQKYELKSSDGAQMGENFCKLPADATLMDKCEPVMKADVLGQVKTGGESFNCDSQNVGDVFSGTIKCTIDDAMCQAYYARNMPEKITFIAQGFEASHLSMARTANVKWTCPKFAADESKFKIQLEMIGNPQHLKMSDGTSVPENWDDIQAMIDATTDPLRPNNPTNSDLQIARSPYHILGSFVYNDKRDASGICSAQLTTPKIGYSSVWYRVSLLSGSNVIHTKQIGLSTPYTNYQVVVNHGDGAADCRALDTDGNPVYTLPVCGISFYKLKIASQQTECIGGKDSGSCFVVGSETSSTGLVPVWCSSEDVTETHLVHNCDELVPGSYCNQLQVDWFGPQTDHVEDRPAFFGEFIEGFNQNHTPTAANECICAPSAYKLKDGEGKLKACNVIDNLAVTKPDTPACGAVYTVTWDYQGEDDVYVEARFEQAGGDTTVVSAKASAKSLKIAPPSAGDYSLVVSLTDPRSRQRMRIPWHQAGVISAPAEYAIPMYKLNGATVTSVVSETLVEVTVPTCPSASPAVVKCLSGSGTTLRDTACAFPSLPSNDVGAWNILDCDGTNCPVPSNGEYAEHFVLESTDLKCNSKYAYAMRYLGCFQDDVLVDDDECTIDLTLPFTFECVDPATQTPSTFCTACDTVATNACVATAKFEEGVSHVRSFAVDDSYCKPACACTLECKNDDQWKSCSLQDSYDIDNYYSLKEAVSCDKIKIERTTREVYAKDVAYVVVQPETVTEEVTVPNYCQSTLPSTATCTSCGVAKKANECSSSGIARGGFVVNKVENIACSVTDEQCACTGFSYTPTHLASVCDETHAEYDEVECANHTVHSAAATIRHYDECSATAEDAKWSKIKLSSYYTISCSLFGESIDCDEGSGTTPAPAVEIGTCDISAEHVISNCVCKDDAGIISCDSTHGIGECRYVEADNKVQCSGLDVNECTIEDGKVSCTKVDLAPGDAVYQNCFGQCVGPSVDYQEGAIVSLLLTNDCDDKYLRPADEWCQQPQDPSLDPNAPANTNNPDLNKKWDPSALTGVDNKPARKSICLEMVDGRPHVIDCDKPEGGSLFVDKPVDKVPCTTLCTAHSVNPRWAYGAQVSLNDELVQCKSDSFAETRVSRCEEIKHEAIRTYYCAIPTTNGYEIVTSTYCPVHESALVSDAGADTCYIGCFPRQSEGSAVPPVNQILDKNIDFFKECKPNSYRDLPESPCPNVTVQLDPPSQTGAIQAKDWRETACIICTGEGDAEVCTVQPMSICSAGQSMPDKLTTAERQTWSANDDVCVSVCTTKDSTESNATIDFGGVCSTETLRPVESLCFPKIEDGVAKAYNPTDYRDLHCGYKYDQIIACQRENEGEIDEACDAVSETKLVQKVKLSQEGQCKPVQTGSTPLPPLPNLTDDWVPLTEGCSDPQWLCMEPPTEGQVEPVSYIQCTKLDRAPIESNEQFCTTCNSEFKLPEEIEGDRILHCIAAIPVAENTVEEVVLDPELCGAYTFGGKDVAALGDVTLNCSCETVCRPYGSISLEHYKACDFDDKTQWSVPSECGEFEEREVKLKTLSTVLLAKDSRQCDNCAAYNADRECICMAFNEDGDCVEQPAEPCKESDDLLCFDDQSCATKKLTQQTFEAICLGDNVSTYVVLDSYVEQNNEFSTTQFWVDNDSTRHFADHCDLSTNLICHAPIRFKTGCVADVLYYDTVMTEDLRTFYNELASFQDGPVFFVDSDNLFVKSLTCEAVHDGTVLDNVFDMQCDCKPEVLCLKFSDIANIETSDETSANPLDNFSFTKFSENFSYGQHTDKIGQCSEDADAYECAPRCIGFKEEGLDLDSATYPNGFYVSRVRPQFCRTPTGGIVPIDQQDSDGPCANLDIPSPTALCEPTINCLAQDHCQVLSGEEGQYVTLNDPICTTDDDWGKENTDWTDDNYWNIKSNFQDVETCWNEVGSEPKYCTYNSPAYFQRVPRLVIAQELNGGGLVDIEDASYMESVKTDSIDIFDYEYYHIENKEKDAQEFIDTMIAWYHQVYPERPKTIKPECDHWLQCPIQVRNFDVTVTSQEAPEDSPFQILAEYKVAEVITDDQIVTFNYRYYGPLEMTGDNGEELVQVVTLQWAYSANWTANGKALVWNSVTDDVIPLKSGPNTYVWDLDKDIFKYFLIDQLGNVIDNTKIYLRAHTKFIDKKTILTPPLSSTEKAELNDAEREATRHVVNLDRAIKMVKADRCQLRCFGANYANTDPIEVGVGCKRDESDNWACQCKAVPLGPDNVVTSDASTFTGSCSRTKVCDAKFANDSSKKCQNGGYREWNSNLESIDECEALCTCPGGQSPANNCATCEKSCDPKIGTPFDEELIENGTHCGCKACDDDHFGEFCEGCHIKTILDIANPSKEMFEWYDQTTARNTPAKQRRAQWEEKLIAYVAAQLGFEVANVKISYELSGIESYTVRDNGVNTTVATLKLYFIFSGPCVVFEADQGQFFAQAQLSANFFTQSDLNNLTGSGWDDVVNGIGQQEELLNEIEANPSDLSSGGLIIPPSMVNPTDPVDEPVEPIKPIPVEDPVEPVDETPREPNSPEPDDDNHTGTILMAVLIPIGVILIVALAVWFFCFRNKSSSGSSSSSSSKKSKKSETSTPQEPNLELV